MSTKHTRRQVDAASLREDDAARLPTVLPMIISIIAVILAFVGPAKQQALMFQTEWRVAHQSEDPALVLPWKENQLVIVEGMYLKVMQRKEMESKKAWIPSVELYRLSLLGKTRVAKGRKVISGCIWESGVALVTESGVVLGVKLSPEHSQVLWEHNFDGYQVESVVPWPRHPGNANFSLLVLGSEKAESPTRAAFQLDSTNGAIIWSVLNLGDEYASSLVGNFALNSTLESLMDPFPIRRSDSGFHVVNDHTIIVSWWWGSALLEAREDGTVHILGARKISERASDSIRMDFDGDGLSERLGVQYQPSSGCVTIQGEPSAWKQRFTYTNCSSSTDPNTMVSLPYNLVFTVPLRRERPSGGAVVLPGNLTSTRLSSRGYNLVVLNPETGQVACIRPEGTVKWTFMASPIAHGEVGGIYVIRPTNQKDWRATLFHAHGSEVSDFVLVVKPTALVLLHGTDGSVASVMQLGAKLATNLEFRAGRFAFALDNGDAVSVDLRFARDFMPPWVFIPVVLLLCTFWACIMWTKLDDV